jgi:hypothetical protein
MKVYCDKLKCYFYHEVMCRCPTLRISGGQCTNYKPRVAPRSEPGHPSDLNHGPVRNTMGVKYYK